MGQIGRDFARDVIPQVGAELIKGRLAASLGGGNLSSRMINAPLTGFTPVNFSTPGFGANFSNGTLDITRTPELQNSLTGASGAFGQQASSLGELLSQVTPGFGRFTEAAVSSLENRRRRAVGNLKENLARRRIAGSSFANDAVARLEAEFAQKEAETKSQAFLRELQASNDLINQQAKANVNEFQTFINQANLEGQTAAQLSNNASILEAANARDLAQITQEQAEDFGAGLDPVLETVGNAAVKAGTAAVGGLLNGVNPFSGSAPETASAVTTALPAQHGGTFTPIGDIPTGIGVPSLGAGTLAGEAPALTAPVSSASLGGSLAGTGAFEATGGVPVAA
ncbi:MAG: hypothetical protein ACE5DX_05820, partial [Candidatus Dojkabacteria bacterium]